MTQDAVFQSSEGAVPPKQRERREYYREWREKNAEHKQLYDKHYHHEHKEAISQRQKEHYQAVRLERLESVRQYREMHREELAAKQREYYRSHKAKCNATSLAYAHSHPDQTRIRRRRWVANHIETKRAGTQLYRAQKQQAIIGPIDLEAIKVRDRMLCCICGKRVAKKDLSFDHVIPLAMGGPHMEWNLRVAHRLCNSRKGAGRLPSQPYLPMVVR